MSPDKKTTIRKKTEHNSTANANMVQIVEHTQNIIKNKFKKACMNRLKKEEDEKMFMQPLAAIAASSVRSNDVKSKEEDYSLSKAPSKQRKQEEHSTTAASKQRIKCGILEKSSPNDLCNRLKLLVASQLASKIDNMEEINMIIAQLNDLDIFV